MTGTAALALILGAFAGLSAQSAVPRIALPAPRATLSAELTLATSVRELPDGRVLIVDRSDKKLLVGDWKTGTVTQVGRNGSGPGEYVQPGILLSLGRDSSLLVDWRNGRWAMLAGASIVATVGPDAPALVSGARQPLGADSQGHVIATRPVGGEPAAGIMPRRDSMVLLRVVRSTGRADTIGVLKSRPATIKIDGPTNHPTAVSILVNPLASGESAVLFADGWVAIGRLDPYRVDWVAPDMTRVRGAALPFVRVPLNEREQRAALERMAERTGNPARDPQSVPDWPEIVPPFLAESLLPAPDRRLWIRRSPTAADPAPPYDVVDRRGALVARVTVAKDVQVIGFGRDAVYTVITDENGIQRLEVRRFPKL